MTIAATRIRLTRFMRSPLFASRPNAAVSKLSPRYPFGPSLLPARLTLNRQNDSDL
jgi:hypothetical protein